MSAARIARLRITLDDVKRVAKKWFDPKRLTIVVAGTIKDQKH